MLMSEGGSHLFQSEFSFDSLDGAGKICPVVSSSVDIFIATVLLSPFSREFLSDEKLLKTAP